MEEKTGEHILSDYKGQCEDAISAFKRDLQKVKTGRASTGLVDSIEVEHYGARQQLAHLGTISVPEPRLILIQVFDATAVPAIEKAIQSSGMGFNPSREGNTIRVSVPALTEEGRKEIVKHLHKIAEDIRVSIRNKRRDSNEQIKKLEKASVLTKDDAKRYLEQIQKVTDGKTSEVDTLLQVKEAECMEV